MLSFRRRGHRPISEVDSSLHQLVYDFRRRTNLLFENYRSVNYRKPESYNLEQLKKEIENTLKTLIDASAVDAGNEDCLIDKILGPVRDGIRYLDDQALEHNDFYNRQAANMEVHSFDIEKILEFWKEKESSITKEYESSQILWNKYCGSKERKVRTTLQKFRSQPDETVKEKNLLGPLKMQYLNMTKNFLIQ